MKNVKLLCVGMLLSVSLFVQPMSVLGEEAVEAHVPTSLRIQQSTLVTPDSFKVGIDEYVTGYLDSSVKKVVLYVNNQNIRNGYVYSDGTFEVEAGDVITSTSDKVEIVGLDRRNNELDRQQVSIEQATVTLTAEDYMLFDSEIRGVAGNQMSVVSLMVNDELIRSVSVNTNDSFVIPVEAGDIIETDDFVEIVGSNSGKELARITVPVNSLDLQMNFNDFEFGTDKVISGKLSGKAQNKAKTVQLYVNRKRFAKAAVQSDGTFSVDSERNISNWKDNVTVAVLNEGNEELSRFQMNLYRTYGTAKWSLDEGTETVTFTGGTFPDTNEGRDIITDVVKGDVRKIIFTEPVEAAVDSSSLFAYLNRLETIEGLTYLDTSKVENMSQMFSGSRYLKELDLSSFNTQHVTTMSHMFHYVKDIKRLDLSSFDTSNVTDMSNMFAAVYDSGGYSLLESIDLSSFDTSKVENMTDMFFSLTSLKELDLSHFNTGNVKNMRRMFAEAEQLTSLDIGSFDTSHVEDMAAMFSGCRSLTRVDVSSFDTGSTTQSGTESMFDKNMDTLILGPASRFKQVWLPEKLEAPYTGRWIGPNGQIFDSANFINEYDGSLPGLYTREKI